MRPEGIRIDPEVIDRCGRAAAVGANWGTLADIAGVNRGTLWRWRRQGEDDIDARLDTDPARLVRAIRDGKGRDAMNSLAILAKAASKGDVRVAMWKLERTHGYGCVTEQTSDAETAAPVVDQAAVLASLPTEVLEELLAARKRTE